MKTKKTTQEEGEITQTLGEIITQISQALASLTKAGINEKAVVVLLTHSTKLPQTTIKKVLQAIRELEKDYGV